MTTSDFVIFGAAIAANGSLIAIYSVDAFRAVRRALSSGIPARRFWRRFMTLYIFGGCVILGIAVNCSLRIVILVTEASIFGSALARLENEANES